MSRKLTMILAAAVFSASAWAQGLATLQGTVTDPSGSVVPNAKVTLTQVATSLARTLSTDTQGAYLFPALPPADYALTVQAQGFHEFIRKGVTLQADQSATVNVIMELGQANQAITVEAAAVLVDTSTGTQKQVVNQTQMVELPLNGRNAAQLSFLVAGAAPSIAGGALQGVSKQFPSQIVVSTKRGSAGPGQLPARRRPLQRRVFLDQSSLPPPRRAPGIQRANQQLRRAVRQ
jgi:hypothetical protein